MDEPIENIRLLEWMEEAFLSKGWNDFVRISVLGADENQVYNVVDLKLSSAALWGDHQ